MTWLTQPIRLDPWLLANIASLAFVILANIQSLINRSRTRISQFEELWAAQQDLTTWQAVTGHPSVLSIFDAYFPPQEGSGLGHLTPEQIVAYHMLKQCQEDDLAERFRVKCSLQEVL